MPNMVRMPPSNGCQGPDNHHPHMMICDDPDDDCYDDWGDGKGYMRFHENRCCIDGESWPCSVKMTHDSQREARKRARSSAHNVEVNNA